MAQTQDIESDLLQNLEQTGPCTLDELCRRLSGYTWSQVISAVDRLSREERLTLQRVSRFDYLISARSGRWRQAVNL
jgi:hypothetical protein